MNAGQASDLIAEFVNASLPKDRRKVFRILKLGMNRAWKEGKWFGMTAEFFVKVQRDAHDNPYIISPRGYSTLLALNVNDKPTIPRDSYFKFHRNGYGDIASSCKCDWNDESFYDEGVTPILIDFDKFFPNGAIIGVRSLSMESNPGVINIQGDTREEERATSLTLSVAKQDCSCFKADESTYVRVVDGIEINIDFNLNYIENYTFTKITGITKPHTRGIVEVYGFDPTNGNGYKIATLYPWDTAAKYKRYRIPSTCTECVHGLFKIDNQPDIIDESQPLIIEDEEAIICLAKAIYFMYHKDDINQGQAYFMQAFNALEKQKREEEVEDVFPIQVIGAGSEDVPEIIRTY